MNDMTPSQHLAKNHYSPAGVLRETCAALARNMTLQTMPLRSWSSTEGSRCSLQLIAGRTAQEINQRKKRTGAFWEDRYHATAVDTNHHLISCLTYMDLNMVPAGAVVHPSQWASGGYAEIQEARERYSIIDRRALMYLLGIPSNRCPANDF